MQIRDNRRACASSAERLLIFLISCNSCRKFQIFSFRISMFIHEKTRPKFPIEKPLFLFFFLSIEASKLYSSNRSERYSTSVSAHGYNRRDGKSIGKCLETSRSAFKRVWVLSFIYG